MNDNRVWLLRCQGEGQHHEKFCFDRKSVGEAIMEFVIGDPSADPQVAERQADELDFYLQHFNDPDNWYNGHWACAVGEIHDCLQAYVIDPKAVKGLLNRVVDEWLGI